MMVKEIAGKDRGGSGGGTAVAGGEAVSAQIIPGDAPTIEEVMSTNMAGSQVIQGDALEVLKTLPSESVNCVATSPPYY